MEKEISKSKISFSVAGGYFKNKLSPKFAEEKTDLHMVLHVNSLPPVIIKSII